MHRKSIVNTIGYCKNVNETYSYPRVDFFRQAQFANLKFELVPSLTGLKFIWDEKNYHDVGPHPKYMERLKTEKDYAAKELAAMLIRAEREFFSLPTGQRLSYFLFNPIRTLLLKFRIDPASLRFWHKKGTQIRIWRRNHRLADIAERKSVIDGRLPLNKSATIQN